MPSFPGSVWSPTTKNTGDVIANTHINDMQDEVVAIEGGYRNGTAPLNSSNSTLANLSVTGGSTLGAVAFGSTVSFASSVTVRAGVHVSSGAGVFSSGVQVSGSTSSFGSSVACGGGLHVSSGTLQVSSGFDVDGNSTLASSITLGAIPYVMPSSGGSTGNVLTCVSTSGSTMRLEWRASAGTSSNPDAVYLELEATQQIAANTTTAINWTAQTAITNSSMHSTATNSERVTPQSTGLYWVQATVRMREAGSTFVDVHIEDSSGTRIVHQDARVADGRIGLTANGLKRFDVTGGWVRAITRVVGSTNSLNFTEGYTSFIVVRL